MSYLIQNNTVRHHYLGEYQTTEFTEDGIIVPKLFYKNTSDRDKTEAIKDIISEAEQRLIREKMKANDVKVAEDDDLSRDLEILQESNSKKIITEIILQPQAWRSERPAELGNQRKSNVPICEDPERPLEAMYQPSVPVVQVEAIKVFLYLEDDLHYIHSQVWDRSYRPRQFERIVYPPGFVNT